MNDGHTQLEETVRERLHEEAADVPDMDAMRVRVLTALENDSWASSRAKRASRVRNGRPFLQLAGVAAVAAIAFAAVTISRQPSEIVNVVTTDPTVPLPVETQLRLDPIEVREALARGNLDEADGNWAVLSETDRVLNLGFVSETDAGSARILRIATPPAGTTPDDVVSSLRSTLFDTKFVADSEGRIGGLETRVFRLETEAGTTRLGFKIATDTYIGTAGIDRVFLVHITTSQDGLVVFWIEASPEEVDEFEAAAGRLVQLLVVD